MKGIMLITGASRGIGAATALLAAKEGFEVCVNYLKSREAALAVVDTIIHTDIHASGGEPGRIARVQDSIPMKRGGTPEEVAEAIVWLSSEKSSYCTGTFIDMAGGK